MIYDDRCVPLFFLKTGLAFSIVSPNSRRQVRLSALDGDESCRRIFPKQSSLSFALSATLSCWAVLHFELIVNSVDFIRNGPPI